MLVDSLGVNEISQGELNKRALSGILRTVIFKCRQSKEARNEDWKKQSERQEENQEIVP